MNKEEAIKYLQQLYPNGGHCWLDEQRIEAISMAVKALQEEPNDVVDKYLYGKDPEFVDEDDLPTKKDYRERYKRIVESEEFRKNHDGMSIGDIVPVEGEEPVSEDLEAAIDTYLATYFGGEKEKQEWPFLKKMAMYFANWQKEKDKKWLADRHKRIFNNGYKEGFEAGRDDAFEELKEEPASEDFEKIVEEIADPTILNAYGTKELARRIRSTICDTSVSDDLGEYINELSKQFPEVSFAKLSRIAVRVAKWQKEQVTKKAGDWVDTNIEKYISADGEWNVDWHIIDELEKYLEN